MSKWAWSVGLVLVLLAAATTSVEAATGDLSQLPFPAGCVTANDDFVPPCVQGRTPGDRSNAEDAIVSGDGRHAYFAYDGGGMTIFDRDSSSGALTQKPGTDGCISGDGRGRAGGVVLENLCTVGSAGALAISPDGRNVYGGAGVYDRNPTTLEFRGFRG